MFSILSSTFTLLYESGRHRVEWWRGVHRWLAPAPACSLEQLTPLSPSPCAARPVCGPARVLVRAMVAMARCLALCRRCSLCVCRLCPAHHTAYACRQMEMKYGDGAAARGVCGTRTGASLWRGPVTMMGRAMAVVRVAMLRRLELCLRFCRRGGPARACSPRVVVSRGARLCRTLCVCPSALSCASHSLIPMHAMRC